tara:strand:- start:3177 stop:3449 length:273 start_codon:yes stop_codon:yes gene_type:complete
MDIEKVKVGSYWKLPSNDEEGDCNSILNLKRHIREAGRAADYYKVLKEYSYTYGIVCLINGEKHNVSELMWEDGFLIEVTDDEYLIGTIT